MQYIDVPFGSGGLQQLAAGEIDIGVPFAPSVTAAADAGDRLLILRDRLPAARPSLGQTPFQLLPGG